MLAACSPSEGPSGVYVRNDLGITVRMSYVVDGFEHSLAHEAHGDLIEPTGQKEFHVDILTPENQSTCTRGDLVARTEAGVEVARIPPPACGGNLPLLSKHVVAVPG